MKENDKAIGIFDSGLGGLTVLKALKQIMPKESFIYFGDIAHLPYGNKSNQSIIAYSKQISQFLHSQNIKSLIIACNTASAIAYKKLKELFSIPIFNVIDSCVLSAVKKTQTKHIAVIGTEATINAKAYQAKIHEIDSNINIIVKACPLFVPIVEEDLKEEDFSYEISQYYLNEIINSNADVMILGCTHYPLLLKIIQKTVGNEMKIIDSTIIAAQHILTELSKKKLLKNNQNTLKDKFYVSDKPQKFNQLAKVFLNNESIEVQKILL